MRGLFCSPPKKYPIKESLIILKKNNSFLIIFLTFIVTSGIYLGAHLVIPSFNNTLNNIANVISTGFEDGGKIGEIKNIIDTEFINKPDSKKLETKALKAYVGALNDPYTEFYTKSEYESLSAQLTGNYRGIGVEVTINENNLITVLTAYKNAPAAKAGIKSGDIILKVNSNDVNGDNYSDAIAMIKGTDKETKDDTVILTIKRGDEIFDTKVTRAEVTMETVESKMLDDNIGYVALSAFAEESHSDFEIEVNSLISSGAKSLIIDLRNNPGGTLSTVVGIADFLLPEGKILTIKGRNTAPEVFRSDKESIDIPMCVLINGGSASASEVLAGALHDHDKAILVGEKTYGKGVVQSIFEISDGDVLKLTTAKYYTPGNVCIDGKGIEPDYKVVPTEDDTEDVQLNKAIEILKKKQ